jgi:hypothetical protein
VSNAEQAEAAKVAAHAKEAEANAVVKFFEEQVFAAARPEGQDGGLGSSVTLRDAIMSSMSGWTGPSVNSPWSRPDCERRLG